MKRLAGRLVQGVVALWVLSLLTFGLSALAPGSPLDDLRLDPSVSRETVAALEAQLGVDRPWPERYGRWLGGVVRGELGMSTQHRQPVAPLLAPRLRNTLVLAAVSSALSWALALGLGLWCGSRLGGRLDRVVQGAMASLLAIPELVLALLALSVAVAVRGLPVGGMTSVGHQELDVLGRLVDVVRHAVLPVATLVLAGLPPLVLHVRAAVHDALGEPFVRAARGHGIGARRVLLGYALPAAAHPLIALFGLSVAGLLSTTLVVEVVFAWPGLGTLMLDAVLARDLYVVVAVTLLTGAFLLLGNLLADAGALLLDPRLRGGAEVSPSRGGE